MSENTHNIQLTKKELQLLNHFIEELSDNMANAGCNDLPQELQDMFTEEEGKRIATEFSIYNNPRTPDGPSWPLPDFCLLSWLKGKINGKIKS